MSDLLRLQDAQALYGLKQAIQLKFKAGQFISLLGMNGSGKSSLLKLICGLNYQSGLLHIQNRTIHSLPSLERARLLSYLPQDPPVSQHWTVHELIKQGLYPHQNLKSVHECNKIGWVGLEIIKVNSDLPLPVAISAQAQMHAHFRSIEEF